MLNSLKFTTFVLVGNSWATKSFEFSHSWTAGHQPCCNSREMPWEEPCLVIWELFESVEPEEVGRVFMAVTSTTCTLDPCPSWPVKEVQGLSYKSTIAMVKSSFSWRLLLCFLRRPWFAPSSRNHTGPLLSCIQPSIFGWEDSQAATSEDPRWSGLSGSGLHIGQKWHLSYF